MILKVFPSLRERIARDEDTAGCCAMLIVLLFLKFPLAESKLVNDDFPHILGYDAANGIMITKSL